MKPRPTLRVKPAAFDFFHLAWLVSEESISIWNSLWLNDFISSDEYGEMYKLVDLEEWITMFGWVNDKTELKLKFNEVNWELI